MYVWSRGAVPREIPRRRLLASISIRKQPLVLLADLVLELLSSRASEVVSGLWILVLMGTNNDRTTRGTSTTQLTSWERDLGFLDGTWTAYSL